MNIDGTVAAYRFPFLLAGNSLVFKQDSHYYEHFYNDLQPYVHYVPVRRNLSDLIEKIQWSQLNSHNTSEIIFNAQNYAREYLQPHHIFCYHIKFFEV